MRMRLRRDTGSIPTAMLACCFGSGEQGTAASLFRKEARQLGGPSFREEALQKAPSSYFYDSRGPEKVVILPVFRHKLLSVHGGDRAVEEGCVSGAPNSRFVIDVFSCI